MLTLVIYDISEDKARTKLAKHLQNYGMRRVQYSGFVGNMNANDRIVLAREIKKYITTPTDSIYVIPLCNRCIRTCKIVADKEIDLCDRHEVKIV